MSTLALSALGSLGLQAITGIIEAHGLVLNVKPTEKIVQDILAMELFVQSIEFIFYTYLVYMLLTHNVDKYITSHRYVDWAITTPFMLVSFVLFFKYLGNPDMGISFWESIEEEKSDLIKIVAANALMLLLGFLAERGIINTTFGVSVGFIPFIYVFHLLYTKYVKDNDSAKILYYFILTVWSLYGVAAFLPFVPKNTMYNILDLFSKNAYGIFLYIYLRYMSTFSPTK